jgi:hypothetical protein
MQKAIRRLMKRQATMIENPSTQAFAPEELKSETNIWKIPATKRIFSISS